MNLSDIGSICSIVGLVITIFTLTLSFPKEK